MTPPLPGQSVPVSNHSFYEIPPNVQLKTPLTHLGYIHFSCHVTWEKRPTSTWLQPFQVIVGNLFHSTFTSAQPGLSWRRKTPGGKNPGSFSTPLSASAPEADIYFCERVTTRASLICPKHFVDQTEEHSPGSRTILAQRRETPAGPRCCSETRNHLAVQRLRKEIVTLETSRARHQQLPSPGGCCPRTRRMLDADSEGPTPSEGREREEWPQEQQLQQQPRDPSRVWSLRSRFSSTAVRREGIHRPEGWVPSFFLPSTHGLQIHHPLPSADCLSEVFCVSAQWAVSMRGLCSPHLPAVGHSKAKQTLSCAGVSWTGTKTRIRLLKLKIASLGCPGTLCGGTSEP